VVQFEIQSAIQSPTHVPTQVTTRVVYFRATDFTFTACMVTAFLLGCREGPGFEPASRSGRVRDPVEPLRVGHGVALGQGKAVRQGFQEVTRDLLQSVGPLPFAEGVKGQGPPG
jgi:hypothetical protein